MVYLSKPKELQAIFEYPRVRLVRQDDPSHPVPEYIPVTDIDRLIMREMQWVGDVVFPWELKLFEERVFTYKRALDVIEFPQKRNTWTGELFT